MLAIIKKILLGLSFLAFGVIAFPESYVLYGKISSLALLFIVFIRPLSDVFPTIKILKKGVLLRKELGILCATYGIAHGAGFFLFSPLPVIDMLWYVFTPSLTNFLLWGAIAAIISIPLLLTSNLASMKFLGKHWKPLQRLTYLFFITVQLHVAFIHPSAGNFISAGITVGIWMILWVLAHKKIAFRNIPFIIDKK